MIADVAVVADMDDEDEEDVDDEESEEEVSIGKGLREHRRRAIGITKAPSVKR